ncbi:hypothetical protein ACQPZ8_27020 [Actinomadura nitritigenes]|uniref:hypothetical protein n=1 Tax=Actinomadura nitritigenes TaxID=134602 RepID=UPI003D8E84AF
MTVVGIAVLCGLFLAAPVLLRSRLQRPGALAVSPSSAEARADEVITAFGEELQRHPFVPAPGTDQEMLADYTRALDAYDEAKQEMATERSDSARRALETVEDGRAALAWLDARIEGRPVPRRSFFDGSARTPTTPAPMPMPEPAARADTKYYSGSGNRRLVVERPPGAALILTVDSPRTGIDFFRVNKKMAARSPAVRSHRPLCGRLPFPAEGSARSRFQIITTGRWRVTVEPPDTAVPFASTVSGRGPEVLSYRGEAAVVTVRHRGRGRFVVARLNEALREEELLVQGKGDHVAEVVLDGPCVLAVHGLGTWTLTPTD